MQYDPFQKKAIQYIQNGHSVIVAAPTGAGKTVIAEHVIEECLKRRECVIYTAPIKALSNQKFRDFEGRFPGKIGVLTGDVSINSTAPVLIMTTEIFRNKLVEQQDSVKKYSWVIFDEIHFLDDYDRGSVWEESLMFLPEHMKVLGLSATVPNVDEMASWFESIHDKSLKIVQEKKRPVPLHMFYQCQNKIYDNYNQLAKHGFRVPSEPSYGLRKIPRYVNIHANRLSALIKHLISEDLLPCLYFVFSRKRTELLAEETKGFDFLSPQQRKEALELFESLLERFDLTCEPSAYQLRPFIERGIAYHHAGMLPTLKEVVEQLFTSRLIKMIFTTETFALGINMPARTVVFDELRKYYGYAFDILKTRDFYQMAGRAGRRSIDTEGFVFCRINPHHLSPRQLNKIIFSPPEEVRSRFNAGYATILNLYNQYQEKLYDIYPLTFHYYQEKKHSRKRAIESLRAKVNILKELGYIRKNKLTKKGEFASRIYGYEFLLSELYEQGVLEELSDVALGVLSVALVYEPRKGQARPSLPNKQMKNLQRISDDIIKDIHKVEKKFKIKPLSKKCHFHLASAMEAWVKGKDFNATMQKTEVDEGELVRCFRMSVQILREVLDASISDKLKKKIYRLMDTINREVVSSEKQLRS